MSKDKNQGRQRQRGQNNGGNHGQQTNTTPARGNINTQPTTQAIKKEVPSGFEKFMKKVKNQVSKLKADPKGRIKEIAKNNPKAVKYGAAAGGALAGTLAFEGGVKAYEHYKNKKKEEEIRNQVNGKK